MFTGIVEGMAGIVAADPGEGGLALRLDLGGLAGGVRPGDSVAVAGCCLTVESLDGSVARFHLMGETLGLTRFGSCKAGDLLNVERSLRIGDRLGGHFVSGHVDGLAAVEDVLVRPGQTDLTVRLPEELEQLVIPKGSIGIEGVSLTVAAIEGRSITVCLIPHTLGATTLGRLRPGDRVHVEMDQIGKWVRRLLP